MTKITYDMLDDFGQVVQTMFRLLYPMGLTMKELEEKAKDFNWLRIIHNRFKEENNGKQMV